MDCFECLEKIIKDRRSHRFFLEKPVEREKIEKILELAMWAPSAMNRQQWFFVVVGKEKMATLKEVIAKSYNSILSRLQKFFAENPKVISLTEQFFKTLGNAPVVIFAYYTPTGDDFADLQSACAAIQNLLLSAHALGLGACWMTGPVHMEREINEALGIQDKKLVAVIPLGYPAKKPPIPPRRDSEKKVIWML